MSGTPGDLVYQCNVCGQISATPMATLDRESRTCPTPDCGSTPRFRSIVYLVSMALFGEGLALPDFPERKDLRGIGMSDWIGYADPLAEKLDFLNTYYHTDPRLDITDISGWEEGSLDFIISSEVFEHVAPPVSVGFENCRKLLKPGGVLILTTPCLAVPGLKTREHFPDLYDYDIVEVDEGKFKVINRTIAGEVQEFEDLAFHEGPGVALEMRLFSEESLLQDIRNAGFKDVAMRRDAIWKYGIFWASPHSWPVSARRGLDD